LCDRYSDSTLAYQLAARKLGESGADLKEMLSFAECGVSPALTLWFDVPVAVAFERMKKRADAGEKATRLDEEASAFHERVAEAFTGQFKADSTGRIQRIDASGDIEMVQRQVSVLLEQRFSNS